MILDKIYNEDCLVGMKSISDESVDCVVSDVPYLLVGGGCSEGEYRTAKGHKQPSGIMNRQRSYTKIAGNEHGHTLADGTKHVNLGGCMNDAVEDVRAGKMFAHNDIKFSDWLPDVYRVLKPNTHCYLMINSRNLKDLQTEAEKVGFKFQNLLVWDKGNGTPNKFYMQCLEFILLLRKGGERWINDMGSKNILRTPNIIGDKLHPTQKPISLMRHMIENSTNRGAKVLDPFMGSGSTAIACVQSERHYIGYEIDPQYYEVAQNRLKNETRQLLLF